MKKIQLGGHRYKNSPIRGYILVDNKDFDEVNKYQWSAHHVRDKIYATTSQINGKMTYLHRWLMSTPKGLYTDHKNGNTLDNRRDNLRVCTNSQNLLNKGKVSSNTSGFRGVDFIKRLGKYRARVRIGGKEKHLGVYANMEDAIKITKKAIIKNHGEFANINGL